MLRLLAMSAVVLSVALHAQSDNPAVQSSDMTTCPVTLANGLDVGGRPSPGRYGTNSISVGVWSDGVVPFFEGGHGFRTPDGAMGTKFGWRRGVAGQLSIEGRRRDAPAPPLRAQIPPGYGDTGFQPSYLIFPTVGCWEVTGQVGNARLTVVMFVTLAGNGPSWVQDL